MRFMLAAIATILSVQSAAAQQLPCANRERVLGFVIDQRGETRLATGDAMRGATIELYAGESGSWTMLLNLPDGRSCLLANGENFAATGELQPARGNPA
ncbi:hypothetical protein [Pararhodobacter sp. CCB-MM2]|uniref:hypothetical protein n=1 Tax=Pararhodobacter sp. CCB-MM2 TaxID=1786003 RepID=UPI00082A2AD7|nr:hypothetical protein [Pararhodobacter sp. CCB-MM2]